jgi:hypothetical protein
MPHDTSLLATIVLGLVLAACGRLLGSQGAPSTACGKSPGRWLARYHFGDVTSNNRRRRRVRASTR